MTKNGIFHGLIGTLILGCMLLTPFVPSLAAGTVVGALMAPDATVKLDEA